MRDKFAIILYLLAVVFANLTVAHFGPSAVIVNAFLLISLDLCLRDRLHEAWHGKHLWRNLALLIGAGSVLSALLNIQALPIAAASFTAFAAAGAVDTLIYAALDRQSRLVRMNASNVFSAAVDSYLFLFLAFGVFPGFWGIVAGQFAAKVLGGVLWAWVLTRRMAAEDGVTMSSEERG